MQNSNIVNNGEYAVYAVAKDIFSTVVDATNNYWGVTDSASIEGLIFHLADSSGVPLVDYVPFAPDSFNIDDTTAVDVEDEYEDILPSEFTLKQNYPNPFNPTTVISYSLARRSSVEITIYNLLGRTVRTLVNEEKGAGSHSVIWDGTNADGGTASTGLYFYRIKAGDFVKSKKMLLLK